MDSANSTLALDQEFAFKCLLALCNSLRAQHCVTLKEKALKLSSNAGSQDRACDSNMHDRLG